ncbi:MULTISPECIES: RtcB family protein [Actinomadura]|uniref:tRNA-splicing ligase RtcB n=1 Tax=Actinomadura madurae TaxID=1993 RepID=A0A1I5HI86_9ACTN|nr:RtcB family protein [Actinomadura madurae]SFO47992.1 tRNA-splicing ligase RtcB [Actinomadura madurae]SPT57771.1 RNA-splicing ligase RtcB [Actinomadura madurae]
MPARQDHRLVRTGEHWCSLPNPSGVPVDICANDDVPLEPAAVDEALALLETAATLERLAEATPGYDGPAPRITRAALTPDLHKGAGIPIGTVLETEHALLPQAVGNDVNCGMRLEVTTLRADRVRPRLDALERRLRHLFFEGGRRIALTPAQREGLLRDGLPGLLLTGEPRWPGLRPEDAEDGLDRVHASGYPAGTAEAFADWIGGAGGASHDSVIGGIGGGNHFAELQYVARVHDAAAAHAWGLAPGTVVTMAHSGSLSLGHQANATALDRLRAAWPSGLPRPRNGILPFLLDERSEPLRRGYLDAFGNAANFAVGNRFFLALTMRAGLAAEYGDMASRLLYDAPHNLFWRDGDRVVHRKGATPAGGHAEMAGGPYAMWGEPVIVPGSMGASSFVLRGHGDPRTLASACHGAGRRVPRGASARGGDAELDAFLREFRVVTPLDHRNPVVARRSDVMAAWRRDLKQEAPWAYKDIGPVVSSLRGGGVATPVAELRPLLTVKG